MGEGTVNFTSQRASKLYYSELLVVNFTSEDVVNFTVLDARAHPEGAAVNSRSLLVDCK